MEIGDCVLVMEGHAGPVTNAALAGSVLLTSSQDSTIRMWDMENGTCLRTLVGHRAAVNNVVITQDARRAVSVSSDETARIWDLQTGKSLHTLVGHGSGEHPGLGRVEYISTSPSQPAWSSCTSAVSHHVIFCCLNAFVM